jgi:hypothetical protein
LLAHLARGAQKGTKGGAGEGAAHADALHAQGGRVPPH